MPIPARAAVRRPLNAAVFFSSAVVLASIAACDIPTSAPVVEQRWIVPGQTSRIVVANLLPSGVAMLPDSSGFMLTSHMASVTRPLSADCRSCVEGDGQTRIKPALVVNATMSSTLASDVSAAMLTSGTLALNLTNNYTFDALRPNGSVAPYGTATITVSNGSTVLGSMIISGSSQSLPANGGQISVNIPLSGQISGGTPLSVAVSVDSPEGSPVAMDASRTIFATAMPTGLKIANAVVSVAGRALTSTTSIDFSDLGDGIADRARRGALLLAINNPFGMTSALSVKLRPDSGSTMTKSITLGTGLTSQSVELTKDELRQLFGHNVTVSISGIANPSTGPISLSPKQAVIVTTHFDLTLSVGN